MDIGDMVRYFERHIAPDAAQDGIDTDTEKPQYSWLADNGYRVFISALRRNHDLTFDEFWSEHISEGAAAWEYEWGTTDQDTIEAQNHFLDRRQSRYGLSESSVDTLRYRLNGYVRAFKLTNDHARLLESVARDGDTPAYQAIDEVFGAFDYLNETTGKSDTTIKRIADIVEAFYSHLVSRRLAATNPAAGLDDEFKWATNTSGDMPALSTEHVRALSDAAGDLEQQLLVVALAGLGLRANEVAALHIDQIEAMTEDTPRTEFDERKNGPGSVSILYGIDVLEERLVVMSDREQWSGYLFI